MTKCRFSDQKRLSLNNSATRWRIKSKWLQLSNCKSSLQALLEEVKQEKPDFQFLTHRKIVARSSRVRVRTRPHLNSRDAFRGTKIRKDFTETWGQKTHLQHVTWEILPEIEESELKRTFKIASQQGWLRLNLIHCTHAAHKCEFKHACVRAWVRECLNVYVNVLTW